MHRRDFKGSFTLKKSFAGATATQARTVESRNPRPGVFIQRTQPLFKRFSLKAINALPMRTESELEAKIEQIEQEIRMTRCVTTQKVQRVLRLSERANALKWVLKQGYMS